MSDDTKVLQELEELKKKISLLEDKEAIRDVLARYGFRFDLGRLDYWYKLWANDAVFTRHKDDELEVIEGKDAIRKYFGTEQKSYNAGQHLQLATVIKVDDDEATAIGYQVVTRHADTPDPIIFLTRVRAWNLQRVEGTWLIKGTDSFDMTDKAAVQSILPAEW